MLEFESGAALESNSVTAGGGSPGGRPRALARPGHLSSAAHLDGQTDASQTAINNNRTARRVPATECFLQRALPAAHIDTTTDAIDGPLPVGRLLLLLWHLIGGSTMGSPGARSSLLLLLLLCCCRLCCRPGEARMTTTAAAAQVQFAAVRARSISIV